MGDVVREGATSVTNQTDDDDTTHCAQVDTSAHPFFMLVYSLVFLVGLVLNGLTMKVYFCSAQQQVSSILMVYLKNLAAADFLLCLCLPLRIANYVSGSITLRLIYCNFAGTAFYFNIYASILFMGYIASNRYLKIVHPHILQTVTTAHIISMVTWVFLLAIMTTYVILSLLTQETLTFVPNNCETLRSAQLAVFYKIVQNLSGIVFLIVLVSMVFFYYSASRSVFLQQQKQLTSSCKKLVKSRRNMLVLVSIFCICFVPYHLYQISYIFLRRQCSFKQVFYYLKQLTTLLSVFNVCLDPLVYFILCKAFRAKLRMRHEGQPRVNRQ